MENKKMKYTIGAIQQKKVMKLNELIAEREDLKTVKGGKKLTLDLKDAYIMTYIKDIYGSKRPIFKYVDGEKYLFIEYDKLIEYIPLLGISNLEALGKRISNYEKVGLIKKHLHSNYSKSKGGFTGTSVFLHLKDSFFDLFEIEENSYSDEEYQAKMQELGLQAEPIHESALDTTDPIHESVDTVDSRVGCIQSIHESVDNNLLSKYSSKVNDSSCNRFDSEKHLKEMEVRNKTLEERLPTEEEMELAREIIKRHKLQMGYLNKFMAREILKTDGKWIA